MEKIAIYDTASGGGTPPAPTDPPALSLIYGQYAKTTRRLIYQDPDDSGYCNLCGGGSIAVNTTNDDSVKGNRFLANYDIRSDFYIAWGEVFNISTPSNMVINLYEDGSTIESWTINSAQLVTNSQQQLVFSSISSFRSGHAYCLRFGLSQEGSFVELTGWSIAVSFNSI
jgi:hypothetical protein